MFPPEQKVDFGKQKNLVPDKMRVMIDSAIQAFRNLLLKGCSRLNTRLCGCRSV